MVAGNGFSNVLGIEEILTGVGSGFRQAVIVALDSAGFDLSQTFGFPNLQLSAEVEGALEPCLSDSFPEEWNQLALRLDEAARVGVLVDMRLAEGALSFVPV